MNFKSVLFTAMLSGSLFVACGDTERAEETAVGEEVVQTQEVLEMEENVIEETQAVRTIEVVARDMDFYPNELRAAPNERIEVVLINEATQPHNIEFELPEGEKILETPVQPGNRASLTFVTPDTPGTYTIYCPVEDHHAKGMEGTLIVE